jgi:hypothetical protein
MRALRATWRLSPARERVRSAGALGFVVLAIVGASMLGASAACGGSPAATPALLATPRPVAPVTLDGGAGAPGAELLPSLDALAARGPTDAPLMREALRVEQAAPRSPDVRAERDSCMRATFAAARPVRAWLADASGAVRGETTTAASGTVPPRGPVCAKKGESLHLVVEDAAPDPARASVAARAVIFVSP